MRKIVEVNKKIWLGLGLVIGGVCLSACSTPAVTPSPSSLTLPMALRETHTPPPATATAVLTLTITNTRLPSGTPTETFTQEPSLTPRVFHYVFPLQPISAAGFIEGTKAHGYPATDIFAVAGTKFVAVTDGVIDFVASEDTWDPAVDEPASRGGLAVAIIGEDGVRYYGSHLSAIAAGIRAGLEVQAGQLTMLAAFLGAAVRVAGGWISDRWGGVNTLTLVLAVVAVTLVLVGFSSGSLALTTLLLMLCFAALGAMLATDWASTSGRDSVPRLSSVTTLVSGESAVTPRSAAPSAFPAISRAPHCRR